MQTVVSLTHVKEDTGEYNRSSIPNTTGVRRIPWEGGKISSNKEEAMRKFYERKKNANQLTTELKETMQATLGKRLIIEESQTNSEQDQVDKKKFRKSHSSKPHANHIIKKGIVSVNSNSSGQARSSIFSRLNSTEKKKFQTLKKSKRFNTKTKEFSSKSNDISLQDRLSLPLDAFVKPHSKTSHTRRG